MKLAKDLDNPRVCEKLEIERQYWKSRGRDPNRCVTIGWLCTVTGLRESEIKERLHRFEDIRTFIGEVVESKEEWLERRFLGIAARKRMHGEKMSLDDAHREMSLKLNTYLKHRVLIEMLIKELNGDKQNEFN